MSNGLTVKIEKPTKVVAMVGVSSERAVVLALNREQYYPRVWNDWHGWVRPDGEDGPLFFPDLPSALAWLRSHGDWRLIVYGAGEIVPAADADAVRTEFGCLLSKLTPAQRLKTLHQLMIDLQDFVQQTDEETVYINFANDLEFKMDPDFDDKGSKLPRAGKAAGQTSPGHPQSFEERGRRITMRETISFNAFKQAFIDGSGSWFVAYASLAEADNSGQLQGLELDLFCEWGLPDNKVKFVEVLFENEQEFKELMIYLRQDADYLRSALMHNIDRLKYPKGT